MNTAEAKDITPRQANLPTIEAPHPMTPMDLMQAAIQSGVDADQLEKLLTLQERYEANQARKAFAAALAEFQADCPVIHKSKQADRYFYAPLDEIMRTIRPHLDSAGLSVRFSTKLDSGIITAICTLTHRDGHSEESEFYAPVDEQMRVNQTQKVGSANTYAKRYALLNALNLSTGENDDDGNAAGTELITDKQYIALKDEIDALEINYPKFCEHLNIDDLANLPAADYPRAERAIEAKRRVVNK